MAQHQSLRPYCETPEDLYAALTRLQAVAVQSIAIRLLVCLCLLTWGLIDQGPSGKAALCLAVVAGLACVWAMLDHIARDSLMHLVTLHDLIRPRDMSASLLLEAVLADEGSKVEADRGE